ncbi:PAS domain S-box protein [Flexistipes sp.]|uniref:PAS domain S-box protein n=1 Tax=Flexistipes sp. TaxID=3088135 RepID=UPI002E1EFD24|nr:PAS domain S-box protein [Flexistipes sp.]
MLKKMLADVFSNQEILSQKICEISQGSQFFQFTTVKIQDVYKTFEAMQSVVENCLSYPHEISYVEIVERRPELLSSIVNIARRHHYRGVTLDYFMSCWKVIVHVIEEEVNNLTGYADEDVRYLQSVIRKTYDACETIFLKEWVETKVDVLQEELMKTNREMTLSKNKYQNVFEGASDLIIITDGNGEIIELNAAAKEYFEKYLNRNNLCVCDLFGTDCDSLFATFGEMSDAKEEYITLNNSDYFLMRVSSLDNVAQNFSGYIVMLNDVSGVVLRNQMLKSEVNKKTFELRKSKKFFKSIFLSTNAGIFIFDSSMNIYTLNKTAKNIVGLDSYSLKNIDIDSFLIVEEGLASIKDVMRDLEPDNTWSGELKLITPYSSLCILATINAMDVEDEKYYSFIFIDISEIKNLEYQLVNEKKMVEEKNIALRNVIQAMTQENEDNVKELCKYASSQLEPMLDNLTAENNSEARRELKIEILQKMQTLKDHFNNKEYNDELSNLTHSESIVCNYIKAGYSTKEIADKLNVSIDTIQTHRKNIRKKFGITDRSINLYSYVKSNY